MSCFHNWASVNNAAMCGHVFKKKSFEVHTGVFTDGMVVTAGISIGIILGWEEKVG